MYSHIKKTILPTIVFVFSLFLPTQLGKHFFFPFSYLSGIRIDYLAPTLYFTDIISLPFIVAVSFQLIKQVYLGKKWVLNNILPILFFIFLLLFNFIFSLSKPLWIYGFARALQCIFLFLFFRTNGNKKTLYSALLWGLLFGSFFELDLSISQLVTRHSIQGWWYFLGERSFSIFTPGIAKAYFMGKEFLRPYGTFSHPNSLGGFYLFIFTFILTQKRITNNIAKLSLLVVCSFLIILSFSRAVLIVYILINLLYFFRSHTSCRICTLAKISIAFVLIFFAFNISGDINSINKRSDFFEKSLSIIAQKPFTGTGVDSYLIAQHNYPQKFSTFFEQPVHTIFLLIVAQMGIPFSVLLFISMYRYIEKYLKKAYFFLPLICILLTGSVDHYWITLQQNMLVLSVLFGIMMYSYEKTAVRN